MPYDPKLHTGRLRRLEAAHYRGYAYVHWTMTIKSRATGWLDARHHAELRELLCHALARHALVCPAYCLMPDHGHFLIVGCAVDSNQHRAIVEFRTWWNRTLLERGYQLDLQPYDHVLKPGESGPQPFAAVAMYILSNPVRAGLTPTWGEYAFSGCVVPGYAELNPRDPHYWDHFWRVYRSLVARHAAKKM